MINEEAVDPNQTTQVDINKFNSKFEFYTGDEVFPNAIYYCQNGDKLVGKAAVRRASIDPRNGVIGVKRKLVEDNWEYTIPALSTKYSPVDVATDIFTYIKEKVSANNGGTDIDGVVISVPYAYGNKERLFIIAP